MRIYFLPYHLHTKKLQAHTKKFKQKVNIIVANSSDKQYNRIQSSDN